MSYLFIVIVFALELKLTIISYVKVYKSYVITIRSLFLLVSISINGVCNLTLSLFVKLS